MSILCWSAVVDVSYTLNQHGINVSSWLEMIGGELYVTSFWELLLPLKRLGDELYVTSPSELLLSMKGFKGDELYVTSPCEHFIPL